MKTGAGQGGQQAHWMAATRSVTRAERAGGDGDGGLVLMRWMDVEARGGGSRPCRRLRLRARSRERGRDTFTEGEPESACRRCCGY
jgi:hypothetical protein